MLDHFNLIYIGLRKLKPNSWGIYSRIGLTYMHKVRCYKHILHLIRVRLLCNIELYKLCKTDFFLSNDGTLTFRSRLLERSRLTQNLCIIFKNLTCLINVMSLFVYRISDVLSGTPCAINISLIMHRTSLQLFPFLFLARRWLRMW